MEIRAAACLALKWNQAADRCASPVFSWYLDRFARGNFTGISAAQVGRLEFLKAYLEPAVQSRTDYLLYQARIATSLPLPEVSLPAALKGED
jgi:hypothetical protein